MVEVSCSCGTLWSPTSMRSTPAPSCATCGLRARRAGRPASAAALAVDAFIGSDTRSRQDRVVGLSRFLIRPSAGISQGPLARPTVPDDFRRYGYRPLLVETFVAPERHAGTSLAASNWRRVGQTAGRGRYAASGAQVPVKAVWLRWRASGAPGSAFPQRSRAPCWGWARVWPDCWAAQELGGAGRHTPGEAAGADRGRPGAGPEKAALRPCQVRYYRFIDQPADCARRTCCTGSASVSRRCCASRTGPQFRGIADRQEQGIEGDAGAASTPRWRRHSAAAAYEAPGKAQRNKPLEERKTMRWIRGLRESSALAGALDGVRPVAVMDREGDVYAVFAEQQRLGNVDLLVRAKTGRGARASTVRLGAGRAGAGTAADPAVRGWRRASRRSARSARSGWRLI